MALDGLVGRLALAAGTVQSGWVAAQLVIIGFRSFLQPVMLTLGIANLGLDRYRSAPGRTEIPPGSNRTWPGPVRLAEDPAQSRTNGARWPIRALPMP